MHKFLRCFPPIYCIVFCSFLRSCRGQYSYFSPGLSLYNATDPIIQWTPSLNDSSTWSPINAGGFSGVQTTSNTATANFTLQGAGLTIFTADQPNFNSILVTDDSKQFRVNLSYGQLQSWWGESWQDVKMTQISIGDTGDSSSKSHSIVIQEDTTPGMNNTGWNLLGISIAPAFTVATSMSPSAATHATTQGSAPPGAPKQINGLSARRKVGMAVGLAFGTLSGVSLTGLLFVCLRRRQRERASFAALPDPLIIPPTAPRFSRPQFRRIDWERIPHLIVPSTAMARAPSTRSTDILAVLPPAVTREMAREKVVNPESSRGSNWRCSSSSTLVS